MPAEDEYTKRYEDSRLYLVRGSLLTAIIALIRRGRPRSGKNTTVDDSDTGTVINATGNGTGGSGTGGGDGSGFETVSGVVNGVPATLRVATDGQGWTPV